MTFTDIKTYFQVNRSQLAALPWEPTQPLTPAELRAVRASLQTFQRGEGTGGDHLMDLARQYSVPDYAAAMQLFIAEEEGHAAMLGRFMDQQGIPQLQTHWLHEVFRTLGRPLGLEHMVRVILTAEVVAAVYYRALADATTSELLRQICRRILYDEEMHLAYHCVAIRQWSFGRGRLPKWLWQQFYRGLMAGTALVVYTASWRTFRAGGYGVGRFGAAIAAEYRRLEQMQQPGGTVALRTAQFATREWTNRPGAQAPQLNAAQLQPSLSPQPQTHQL
ncbi:ferritin-like domain-containing protein [Hymenobacter properus]|uniref:Ferritin-like domain-containing protein n=1 Tax=Hymenobacter properus TaxID=2791026 RepID=A0A931BKP6_9BACT|nr:ferritin-like domain-containing protein [Hymenobacter properus]MBF9142023.1 ferritin-like domain-containing protein [Hymenobacter properus]MBR7720830.1 ferritin-like domain-containing protein [Microvirga sp. SRT04]